MPSSPVISLQKVSHYYGTGALRKQILFEINANFYPGEIVILTGPSGSGKTTLLTLVGALRSIQEGSLVVLGQELRSASPSVLRNTRKSIGFIFQGHNLLEALTARQNVQLSLLLHGSMAKDEAENRAAEMLESVGLGEWIDQYPGRLSGGQKQRVAIARALVARPKIVLADEPTAALDRRSGREVVEILQQLARQQGATILLVTHDHRILDVADRILALEDGRITSFARSMTAHAGQTLHALSQLNRRGLLGPQLQDLTPGRFVEVLEESTHEMEQLLRTFEAAEQQVTDSMLDQILEVTALKLMELMNAERAAIFVKTGREQLLRSKVATSNGSEPLVLEIPAGEGIAGHVVRTGELLNVPDAQNHPMFSRSVDRSTGFHTRSILCVPICDRAGAVIAVAELLNKRSAAAFDEQDELKFLQFARPLGVILETCGRLSRRRPSASE